MRQLTLWLAITVASVIAASVGTVGVSQVMASANSFTVVPLLGGALIPTPSLTAPHNWAKLLITEMVVAEDFDDAPDTGENFVSSSPVKTAAAYPKYSIAHVFPRRMSLGRKTSTLLLSDHAPRRR